MRRQGAPQPAADSPVTSRRKLAELDPPWIDRISALSDDLLHEIIRLLPMKDGARTQALASRWRHLWRSATLNLDCCDLVLSNRSSYCGEASTATSPILSAHPGPVRRLCTRSHRLRYDNNKDDPWLRSAALDNLEELEFAGLMRRPPASIFRFSATLHVASLADCNLPDDIVKGLHLPRLKQLGLERVHVSETSLDSMIAGCPTLEFLLVHSCSGFRCLRINSLCLTSLCVHIDLQCDKIIIVNAPRLERFIYLYKIWGLDVSVYYTPTEEAQGFLTDLQKFARELSYASTVIPVLPVDSPVVHTVKSLSVNMDLLNLDKVIDFMRLFPCLEKVHIKSDLSDAKHWWCQNWRRRKHRNFIRYHDIRVKTIVLEPYLGTLSHINFATFFVLNARDLDSMTFHIESSVYNERFLAELLRKLHVDNMASGGARFHFRITSYQRAVLNTKHLRDFDLIDPFLDGC